MSRIVTMPDGTTVRYIPRPDPNLPRRRRRRQPLPDVVPGVPLVDRVAERLRHGPRTVAQLALVMSLPEDTVRTALTRGVAKRRFVRFPGRRGEPSAWSLR